MEHNKKLTQLTTLAVIAVIIGICIAIFYGCDNRESSLDMYVTSTVFTDSLEVHYTIDNKIYDLHLYGVHHSRSVREYNLNRFKNSIIMDTTELSNGLYILDLVRRGSNVASIQIINLEKRE